MKLIKKNYIVYVIPFILIILLLFYYQWFYKRRKVNIIFPIRDREEEVEEIIPIIKKFFKEKNIDYKIYLIEQSSKKKFNKGKLVNIGFIESINNNFSDQYYISDIDIYPKNNKIFDVSHISNKARQIYSGMQAAFGGVFFIDSNTYTLVNGFSNNFWGWGSEDIDFMNRLISYGIDIDNKNTVYRNSEIALKEIHDKIDTNDNRKKTNIKNKEIRIKFNNLYKQDLNNINKDGLNTCEYKILNKYEYEQDTTRILVDI